LGVAYGSHRSTGLASGGDGLERVTDVDGRAPPAFLVPPGNRRVECPVDLEDARPVAGALEAGAGCGGEAGAPDPGPPAGGGGGGVRSPGPIARARRRHRAPVGGRGAAAAGPTRHRTVPGRAIGRTVTRCRGGGWRSTRRGGPRAASARPSVPPRRCGPPLRR